MKTKASIFILLAIGVVCLISYFFHKPVENSELENRTLMTFDMVINNPPEKGSIVYKPTASERFEEALKDQFLGRDWITIHYTSYTALLDNIYSSASKLTQRESDVANITTEDIEVDYERWPGYGLPRLEIIPSQDYSTTKIGSLFRFNDSDYIFEGPIVNPPDSVQVEAHAKQIEHIHELYPNIQFYSYFVSSLSSTKWFDGQLGYDTTDYFETIAQAMPEYMKVRRLVYQDETGYKNMFYKSDHHCCYQGFMQGYLDIYDMIAEDYENLSSVKNPIKIWNFSDLYGIEYRGSRANTLQELYDEYDEFIVPEYNLGERTCFSIDLNSGEETPVTLCLWNKYKAGEISTDKYYDHYIHFYATAYDKYGNDFSNEYYLIRNEGSNTGHNLLLVTDSTGRAMRDVLGSHFDSMVYLDYRNMSSVKVDEIIDKYNIDTIVMNGLGAVWTGEEYSFHFTDGFGDEEK